jgi:hypothetical protein
MRSQKDSIKKIDLEKQKTRSLKKSPKEMGSQ